MPLQNVTIVVRVKGVVNATFEKSFPSSNISKPIVLEHDDFTDIYKKIIKMTKGSQTKTLICPDCHKSYLYKHDFCELCGADLRKTE